MCVGSEKSSSSCEGGTSAGGGGGGERTCFNGACSYGEGVVGF